MLLQIGYLLSFIYFKTSKQDFLILFHSFQARLFSLLFFNFQKKSLPFLPLTLIHSIPLKFTHFISLGTLKQSVMFYFSFCGPFFMVYNHSINQWRRWVIMFIFVLVHAFHFCICFWVFGFWVWKYQLLLDGCVVRMFLIVHFFFTFAVVSITKL